MKKKQKKTMKQKVSQNVIVNIKNALPKQKPRRKTGTGQSKTKGLSSQYTNPYLIGSFSSQIQDLKNTIEKKKAKKPLLALPAPEPQRAQDDVVLRLMDAMRQHRDNNQAQGNMVANIQAQVRAEERAIVHNNPEPQVQEPEDNGVPFPFQYEEVLNEPVVPSQRKQRGGARAGAGRPRKNKDIKPATGPIVPQIQTRSQTAAQKSMEEVLAESEAIMQSHIK